MARKGIKRRKAGKKEAKRGRAMPAKSKRSTASRGRPRTAAAAPPVDSGAVVDRATDETSELPELPGAVLADEPDTIETKVLDDDEDSSNARDDSADEEGGA